MKRALVAVLFGCLTLGVSSLAVAGEVNDQAAISVHISSVVTKDVCASAPALTNATMNVGPAACGPGTLGYDEYTVWMFVCNGSDSLGISGVEFGIDYNGDLGLGVDAGQWDFCGDLQFPNPNWPDAGTGNIVTWAASNCNNTNSEPFVPGTVIAIAGALQVYVYSPDLLSITPRPISGAAKVADCNGAETDLTANIPTPLGIAGFCLDGFNPCGLPTAVEKTTWGSIKKLD
jgi:hypothetical protein